MLTKTKFALAAALILGTASAALANDTDNNDSGPGGHSVQSWQAIQQAWQNFQRPEHMGNAGDAYGYVASPNQNHRTLQNASKTDR